MKTTSKSLVIGLVGAIALAGCGDDNKETINLRVAHLSPGAPAVDLCVKLGSGSFTGPVLKGLGVTAGLAYSQVTKYLTLDAGQYTARLVAPNAADCSTSLAGLPDYALPSLPGGTYATAAAVGLVAGTGTSAFTVKPFVDKYTSAAGKADIRFIHASPGTPNVDVGVGNGTSFTPIFTDVAYPDIGLGTGIDANGYYATAPLTDATLSARANGTTADALVISGVSLAAGQTATAFAIGIIGNTATPLAALVCVDNAAPVSNLATCSVLPQKINLRVAHLSPNAPPVDFCVKLGSGSFSGPVLKGLGATAGLAYSQVTKYLTLDNGQYTARLVAPNAANCNTSLAGLPDYVLPSLSGGTYATAAAVGLVAGTGTSAFTVKPFVDDYTAPAGQIALRFVHASPGTPNVDVGVGSGTSFTPIFTNVAYPDIGSGTGIDANGYYATAPLTNATVSARVHGTTTDALVIPGVDLAAGDTATAFAIGIIGVTATPLEVLACIDNAPPVGNLSDCFVAP